MSKLKILEGFMGEIIRMGSSKSGFYGHAGRPGKRGGSARATRIPAYNQTTLADVRIDLEKTANYFPMFLDEFKGMTGEQVLDQARGNLSEYVDSFPLSINVPLEAAEAILTDGRFKNQYEVGQNADVWDAERARGLERASWDIKDDDPKSFPIYGYINDGAPSPGGQLNPTHMGRANVFGNIEFQMKDQVKDRATVTVSDSMEPFGKGNVVGTPIKDLRVESIPSMWLQDVANNNFSKVAYVETQIHGGVNINDVAKIIVHGVSSPISSLDRLAGEAGLEVVYGD